VVLTRLRAAQYSRCVAASYKATPLTGRPGPVSDVLSPLRPVDRWSYIRVVVGMV